MNMSTSLLYSFLTIVFIHCSQCQKETISFSAISVLHEGTTGKSIVGAQWLAMQEINNNSDLLPNITLELLVYDAEGDGGIALVKALTIIDLEGERNHTHFPIILGCPWSSLSTVTSPAFGAFKMGQISSGATSISLADTSKYPYFYRTIPSDALQAQGIILLCREFNWTKIAVVYVNDAYGLYLSIGITELALDNGIEATGVAFSSDEPGTLTSAAYQVAQLNTFIIIFIVHDTMLDIAFEAFSAHDLTGYPYYYIGVDAWLDSGSIQSANVTRYAAGSIGTVPWQTLAMPLDTYDDIIRPVINTSMHIYNKVLSLWSSYYNNGYADQLYVEIPSSTAIYGYDAMYTLAKALQVYIDNGNVVGKSTDININKLNEIIVNDIDFVGASGRVIFDKRGDRAEGLYAFGNAFENGQVQYFGYFYQNGNELALSVEYDKIVWPTYFTEKGITPQSGIITTQEIVDISQRVLIPIYVLSIVSIFVTVLYAVLTWIYHDNRVLRAASWKINLIMCVGCLCGYIAMIVYGIDEHSVKAGPLFTFLCNFRLWMWIISYTLLFMPLFAKTYRLSRIFSEILEKKHLEDKHLLYGILICVVVDLFLLILYTAIEPLQRIYISGSFEKVDELQRIQYMSGSCETTLGIQYIFYGLISLWKCIETLFGIYCALSVSRVGREELSQFDETTQQLLSIGFLILALCVIVPLGLIYSEHPSYFYLVIGLLTISVGNVTATLNMLPRLYALVRGNAEEKYSQSAQEKMEERIIAKLRKMGVDEEWWRKATTIRSNNSQNDVSNARLAIQTQSGVISEGTGSNKSSELPPVIDDEDDEVDGELDKKSSINYSIPMSPLDNVMEIISIPKRDEDEVP